MRSKDLDPFTSLFISVFSGGKERRSSIYPFQIFKGRFTKRDAECDEGRAVRKDGAPIMEDVVRDETLRRNEIPLFPSVAEIRMKVMELCAVKRNMYLVKPCRYLL